MRSSLFILFVPLICLSLISARPAAPVPAPVKVDPCQLQGLVFVESVESFADYRVYVEDVEAFADLKVFRESVGSFADRPGVWAFTDVKNFADFSIAYTDVQGFADFSVFYTDFKSLAGCGN